MRCSGSQSLPCSAILSFGEKIGQWSGNGSAIPRFTIGNVAYLVGIGLAFLNPLVSLLVYGLVAVYYVFPTLPAPQSAHHDD